MFSWACIIWPLLFGALIGWLACGWFARRLRSRDWSGVILAKDADLARMARELADAQSRPPVEVARWVDRVVEKPVDNPAHLAEIVRLSTEAGLVATLRQRVTELENAPSKAVERVVEKLVPDTAGLAERDAEIELLKRPPTIDLAAARRAGFNIKSEDDLAVVEGIGPKIAELFHAHGVRTFAQLAAMTPEQIQPMLTEAGPHFRMANPETWPEQAELAMRNRWPALHSLQSVLVAGVRTNVQAQKQERDAASHAAAERVLDLERQLAERNNELQALRRVPAIDVAAAHAAGFAGVRGDDDLQIIEGIGPKIAELFKANGIATFAQLAQAEITRLQTILDGAGSNFRMAKPQTWPEQAELAMRNRWQALKALQDELNGGQAR